MLLLLWLVACSDTELNAIKDPAESVGDDGGVPCLQVDPTSLDVGEDTVDITSLGYTELSATLTLSNDCGEADATVLTLDDVQVDHDELTLSALEVDELDDGASTEVVVTWTPTDGGTLDASVWVSSDDPDDPELEVPVTGLLEVREPELEVDPWTADLGEVEIGASESVTLTISNAGEGTLEVEDLEFITASKDELTLTFDDGEPPWTFLGSSTDSVTVTVTYAPLDEGEDAAELLFTTNEPDDPEDSAVVSGEGVQPAHLGCWYTRDDGTYETVGTDSSYPIDSHGSVNLYYYEPSGARGLQVAGSEAKDFATLLDYVVGGYTDFSRWTSTQSFSSTSSASYGSTAHFTYYLCDWTAEATVKDWSLSVSSLDDGMLVLLNEEVVTYATLGQSISTSLDVVPGTRNSLVLLHVDDASVDRRMVGLGLYADGVLYEGTE